MNKFRLLFIVVFFYSISAYSQIVHAKDIRKIKGQKILLVVNKNDETNFSEGLKKSMEKYWTFCAYEAVFKEDLDTIIKRRYKKIPIMGYFLMDEPPFKNLRVFGVSNIYKKQGALFGAYNYFDFPIKLYWPVLGYKNEDVQSFLDMHVGILNEIFLYAVDTGNKYADKKFFYASDLDDEKGQKSDRKTLFYKKDLYLDSASIKEVFPYPFEIVDKEEYLKAISERRDVNIYWFINCGVFGVHSFVNPSSWHIKSYSIDGPLKSDWYITKSQENFLHRVRKFGDLNRNEVYTYSLIF